jgi:hypothetical protein
MYEVYDKHSVLFQLKRIIITEDSFNFIAERYIEEDDSALRGTTIGALLYHKGYFSSADGPTYSTKITRFFHFADIDTRRELVEKLRTGIHVEISKQDLFDLLAKQYIHDRNERVIFGLLNNEGYGEALGVAEKKKLARALTSLNIDKRKELVEKLRTGLPFEAPAKGIAKSTPKLIIKGNMERFRTSTSRYTDGNRHVYLRGLEENYDALLEIMRENECEILNTKDEKFVREAELLWKNQRIFLKYDDIIGTFFYTAEKEELPLLEELAGNVIARARELL